MNMEFVIPASKNALLGSPGGEYGKTLIKTKYMMQRLKDAGSDLKTEGFSCLPKHFDTFFSLIIHGNKMEYPFFLRAFEILTAVLELLVRNLESEEETAHRYSPEEKLNLRSILKILAYLLSEITVYMHNYIQTQNEKDVGNVGKKKRGSKNSEFEDAWDPHRTKMFELMYRWLQLPLHNFWEPPIVEDAFISLLTNSCYKVLESMKDVKYKPMRENIFEILGTLIKRYNYGTICIMHIMQLVKTYEALANPIGQGIVYMVKQCNCTGLVKNIVAELGITMTEEDSRRIAAFLEAIAVTDCSILIPILDMLLNHLESDFYPIRNGILDILSKVVQHFGSEEGRPEKEREIRDTCLEYLMMHVLDVSSYTRSKVLSEWQKLCCLGVIPLAHQADLLQAAVGRLDDKSANVKKQALQLIRALLQGNPFGAKMNKVDIKRRLERAKHELFETLSSIVQTSAKGSEERIEFFDILAEPLMAAVKKEINISSEENEEASSTAEVNDENFEKIRQYLLKNEIKAAVKLTGILYRKIIEAQEKKNVSTEVAELGYLCILYKVFTESETIDFDNINKQAKDIKSHLQDRNRKVQNEKIDTAKKLVQYLENTLKFATALETGIPLVTELLFSKTLGDAVESCTLMGVAFQFKVTGSEHGFRQALFQMYFSDDSVKNNVAAVYKTTYLTREENQTERQHAMSIVQKLITLTKELVDTQVTALSEMFDIWRKEKDLSNEVLKVLWEVYSNKIPNVSMMDRRTSVILLKLMAMKEPDVIVKNVETLVKVGFKLEPGEDLLLARDTCRALLEVRNEVEDVTTPPKRYLNDHYIFTTLQELISNNFAVLEEEKCFNSFVLDAINVIYHLADAPETLMLQILKDALRQIDEMKDPETGSFDSLILQNLFNMVGHCAMREMIHLDNNVYKELKRRSFLRDEAEKNKNSMKNIRKRRTGNCRDSIMNLTTAMSVSTLRDKGGNTSSVDMNQSNNNTDSLEGATAEDADAEEISEVLEKVVVGKKGFLGQFEPIIKKVCENPNIYKEENLQAVAVLALTKMMTVSSIFCKDHLQLLMTILETTQYSGIRCNIIIALSDLISRHHNIVQPWTSHIYKRLGDPDPEVRMTCVKILSSLIMRGMILVKGQVAQLALCIVDEDEQIAVFTKQFFTTLAEKEENINKLIPDILSCMTDINLDLKEEKFKEIMTFILHLIQKETSISSTVEKICNRFMLVTSDVEMIKLSFCLSLLQFNKNGIRSLINLLPNMKEKIHCMTVSKTFYGIIQRAKKKNDKLIKEACLELEEKLDKLLECNENAEKMSEDEDMPPPKKPAPKAKKMQPSRRRGQRSRKDDSSDDDSSDSDSESLSAQRRNKRNQRSDSSPEENEAGASSSQRKKNIDTPTQAKKKLKTPVGKRKKIYSSSDEQLETPRTRTKTTDHQPKK